MSIKMCISFTESYAHLQGRERQLLPVVDVARAEHEELLELLKQAVYYMDFDNGSAYISIDFVKKQDELCNKIKSVIHPT